MNNCCLYFKARIPKAETVRFAALFRSMEDNFAFDRTEDSINGIFEFYVPKEYGSRFILAMNILKDENLVIEWWEDRIEDSLVMREFSAFL